MADFSRESAYVLLAYALGCLSTGYYYCRIFSKCDVRAQGDGTTSANNVRRHCGKLGFIVTLVGDFISGIAAITIAALYGTSVHLPYFALLAVTFGNIAPLQLQFRGGRGLGVAAGGLAAFQPTLLLCIFSTYSVLKAFLSNTELSRLVAIVCVPVFGNALGNSPQHVGLLCAFSILLLHHYRGDLPVGISKARDQLLRRGENS